MRWQVSGRAIVEPAIVFILLALLWEYAVAIFGIKRYLLPPLSDVLSTLWQARVLILKEAWVTTGEILVGYFWAVLGGMLLGFGIFAWPFMRRTVYPLIVLFQGLPKVALAPVLVVWFGYGLTSKVLMAFFIAFFPVVVSTLGGLAGTPEHLLEHFRAIRASPITTFVRLRIPAALPSIVDGCKTAMPLAVIGAIVGEFVASEHGLGHLILEANANAKPDLLFAALIAISLLTGLLYALVELAATRVWWRAL